MMNMKLLAVVTPPYIYHGCYTRKTLWEEIFTGEETFLSAVNMKILIVIILVNIERSRVVTSMSLWTTR